MNETIRTLSALLASSTLAIICFEVVGGGLYLSYEVTRYGWKKFTKQTNKAFMEYFPLTKKAKLKYLLNQNELISMDFSEFSKLTNLEERMINLKKVEFLVNSAGKYKKLVDLLTQLPDIARWDASSEKEDKILLLIYPTMIKYAKTEYQQHYINCEKELGEEWVTFVKNMNKKSDYLKTFRELLKEPNVQKYLKI